MPVQSNPAIQNVATVAFDGTESYAADIRKFVRFGWSFEVVAPVTTDLSFQVQASPPSAVNDCIPADVWGLVPVVPTCQGALEGEDALFTIPAGTPVGTICSGTIPCRPDAFVRVSPTFDVVGTAPIRVVLVRQGPKI